MILELFADSALSKSLYEAVVDCSRAEALLVRKTFKVYQATPVRSRSTGSRLAAQVAAHTPPDSSYDPAIHLNLSQVLRNRKFDELDEAQFYYAFRIRLRNLRPESIEEEKEEVLKGVGEVWYDKMLRCARVAAGLEILVAHLTRKEKGI